MKHKPEQLHGAKDAPLNPELKNEVSTLRGAIADQVRKSAEREGLPDRFRLTPNREHGNQMDITDTATGRRLTIGLCDVHGAIQALAFFFPIPETPVPTAKFKRMLKDLESGRTPLEDLVVPPPTRKTGEDK